MYHQKKTKPKNSYTTVAYNGSEKESAKQRKKKTSSENEMKKKPHKRKSEKDRFETKVTQNEMLPLGYLVMGKQLVIG